MANKYIFHIKTTAKKNRAIRDLVLFNFVKDYFNSSPQEPFLLRRVAEEDKFSNPSHCSFLKTIQYYSIFFAKSKIFFHKCPTISLLKEKKILWPPYVMRIIPYAMSFFLLFTYCPYVFLFLWF